MQPEAGGACARCFDVVDSRHRVGGTLLWVRETWATLGNEDGHPITADGKLCRERDAALFYRADAKPPGMGDYGLESLPDGSYWEGPWRPSIHMPRWASRLALRVTSVRVERLQEISEEDAKAEGVSQGDIPADEDGPLRIGYVLGPDDGKCVLHPTRRRAFEVGWDSINGARPGCDWQSNPWVWRIGFERASHSAPPPGCRDGDGMKGTTYGTNRDTRPRAAEEDGR